MKKKVVVIVTAICFVYFLSYYFEKYDKINIACIGDSNTEGHGLFPRWLFSYPAKLQSILGKKFQVHNYGIAGATIANEENLYVKSNVFNNSTNRTHAYYIFMLGTNDSKDLRNGFYQKYRSLIDQYDIKDNQTVILCTPPRAFSNRWGINDSVITKYISKDILRLADEFGYTVLDINSILNSKEYFQEDGIHLNSEGSEQVAYLIKKVLSAYSIN
jgi:lysophospholipase L1-like esterase